jgi:hypothetical protein
MGREHHDPDRLSRKLRSQHNEMQHEFQEQSQKADRRFQKETVRNNPFLR